MSPAEGRSFWFFCPVLLILAARGFVVFRAVRRGSTVDAGSEEVWCGSG